MGTHDLAAFARQPRIDARVGAHDFLVADIEAARDVGERVLASCTFVTCTHADDFVLGRELEHVRRDRLMDRRRDRRGRRRRVSCCRCISWQPVSAQRDAGGGSEAGGERRNSWRHYYLFGAVRHIGRPVRLQQHRPVRQLVAVARPGSGVQSARRRRGSPPPPLRARRRARTPAPCGGRLRPFLSVTRPLKPRSATISTSRSASRHK